MRLAELTLERYGRFEGCSLTFRAGTPDLHVIYGANEAGKSTTMAAVSDLLFGFPPRSPQNYRFDYPLLRVGAVLEEDDRRLACRRRKANAQSLVNAEDRPIDEGPLLAMLRGQDRERFWRGFSLDQTRLREGDAAMVGAKDDLGQALFAAGSGLTGVAEALAALEREADEIWGRRAAARRLYTVAERRHEEARRALRDLELRPRPGTTPAPLCSSGRKRWPRWRASAQTSPRNVARSNGCDASAPMSAAGSSFCRRRPTPPP